MSKKAKSILVAVGVLLLAAAMIAAFFAFSKKPVEGSKTVTVSITHKDGTEKKFTLHTDAKYLLDAIKEYDEDLLQGEQAQYGLYIKTIDGYTCNETAQEWWGYTKSGEYVETGVELTPIYDGDSYEFTLNIGYDFG
jgi:hypothetical protein